MLRVVWRTVCQRYGYIYHIVALFSLLTAMVQHTEIRLPTKLAFNRLALTFCIENLTCHKAVVHSPSGSVFKGSTPLASCMD